MVPARAFKLFIVVNIVRRRWRRHRWWLSQVVKGTVGCFWGVHITFLRSYWRIFCHNLHKIREGPHAFALFLSPLQRCPLPEKKRQDEKEAIR